MPDLPFVLPHWLYWSGLVGFPLMAMLMVRRERRVAAPQTASLPIGYLLLLTAGFVGIHRFYVRNWKGVFYIPLFLGIIVCNVQARGAREVVSLARSDVSVAAFDVEMAEEDLAADPADERAAAALAEAADGAEDAQHRFTTARANYEWWSSAAGYLAASIALLMLIDVVLMPSLVRRCRERERAADALSREDEGTTAEPTVTAAGDLPADTSAGLARVIHVLETPSRYSGEFVASWAVIAVFAYYYEVLARYIFNSPTNWVHEGMFLMFGMMFVISGAYAYRSDSHVRVDILYAHLSPRGKALTDLLTSIFFFIFAGTMLVTGWIFTMDSFEFREVSFTEWAIQYWPVKTTLVIGAALILLQGVAKMLADVAIVLRPAKQVS